MDGLGMTFLMTRYSLIPDFQEACRWVEELPLTMLRNG